MRIIAEVTYSFDTNTIERDRNVQVVTSETTDSYYCEVIGTPFKKAGENEVRMVRGGVVPYLSVFKTLVVKDEYFNKETNKLEPFVQYAIDNLNAELVERIREELKNRVETARII
jgi:hypothetical protein